LLYSPGWPQTLDPPVSDSLVLGSQVWTVSTSGFTFEFLVLWRQTSHLLWHRKWLTKVRKRKHGNLVLVSKRWKSTF
jgi:hypothetical protein